MFFLKILRYIFCSLDFVVAWLIVLLYELFMQIANITLDPSIVTEFTGRIYALLGIIMLFKLAFSFINYIANPDAFSDTAQGAKKTFMNVFVVLILIIATPTIFDLAFEAQALVLRKNIIPKIIMGTELNQSGDESALDDIKNKGGRQMAFIVFTSFYEVNNEIGGYTEAACGNVYGGTTAKDKWDNGHKCFRALKMDSQSDVETYYKKAVGYDNSSDGIEDVTNIFNAKYYNAVGTRADGDDGFIFNYIPLIPSACGLFIAYVLLIFCIDIAVRAIKLAVLQLIAPVPIISYIDPKKGKEVFNKWVNLCVKTYLDVFLRLVTIFFVLYLIQLLTNLNQAAFIKRDYEVERGVCVSEGGTWMGDSDGNEYCAQPLGIFLVIFLILGLLKFAEEAPKLLQDLFGINLDGKFSLSPSKALGKYGSSAAGMAGGALGGMAANTLAAKDSYKNRRDAYDNNFKGKYGKAPEGKDAFGNRLRAALGTGGGILAGGASGGRRGLAEGAKGKGFGVGTAVSGSVEARDLRGKRTRYGYTAGHRAGDTFKSFAGTKTYAKTEAIKAGDNIGQLQTRMSEIGKQMYAADPTSSFKGLSYNMDDSTYDYNGSNYKTITDLEAKNSGITGYAGLLADYTRTSKDLDDMNKRQKVYAQEKAAQKDNKG